MTSRLLLHAALLAMSALPARASGINLGWDDCPGGAAYSAIKTFACDTNAGIHTLVGSFIAPAGVEMMSANEVIIDMATAGAALPDWWKLGTGRCRPTSLSLNVDFQTGPFTCYDYWQGGAIGGISQDPAIGNRVRIKSVLALPAGDPRITSVAEGVHVYSFKVNLNSAKTTGLGSCAGCNVEACIVLLSIRLNQPPPLNSIFLSSPATAQHVTWQGWSNPNPIFACPYITPAKRQTWGSIKALYR